MSLFVTWHVILLRGMSLFVTWHVTLCDVACHSLLRGTAGVGTRVSNSKSESLRQILLPVVNYRSAKFAENNLELLKYVEEPNSLNFHHVPEKFAMKKQKTKAFRRKNLFGAATKATKYPKTLHFSKQEHCIPPSLLRTF